MAYNINNVKSILVVMITLLMMNGQAKALRADIRRMRSISMSSQERLRAAVHRSTARLKRIETSVKAEAEGADVGVPVNRGDKVGEFLITMSIGTPPHKMVAIMDTGSDLIWTQCKPCVNCFTQPHPIFDPAKSTTYNKLPCSASLCSSLATKSCTPDCQYFYQYGDGSKTAGVLSNETLTLWDSSGKQQSIPGIAFGCSHDTEGRALTETDGLVGLGRGNLSLISQIDSTIGSKFSYCLTTYLDDSSSETSPLFFGSAANLMDTRGIQSTPMMKNSARPDLNTFYYISVESISVGGRLAALPEGTFDIRADGGGGFIIDSGTTVTYLAPTAFSAVAEAMNSVIRWNEADGSHYGFSLCYQIPSTVSKPSFPDMTFHLNGGAEYVVKGKFNFGVVDEQTRLVCLLMLEMDEASAAKAPSILGNMQQQNYHILYDNGNQQLSFTPANCSDIAEPVFDKSFLSSGSPARGIAGTVMSLTLAITFLYSVLIPLICL